jgi:CHAD domain-containing protein
MKKLAKYIKNREAAIDFLLRKPRNKFTQNTYHKLRIEIKKLNSVFDLIRFYSTDFRRKKTYNPFKSIFRQAGKIRELQIEAAMLKKYFRKNSTNDYDKRLKKLRLKAEEDFFLLVNKKLMNQLNKKYQKIIPHLHRINQKNINTYLDKKKNYIQELLVQESVQIEQIHKLRKQLKILNYNKALVDKEKPEEKLSKQDVLPELLGKWHDCQVIIKHLKKTLKKGQLSLSELNQIKIIKSKIVHESNVLLNEIRNALPESGLFVGYN